ncbi:MAG: Ig-like domain-containing protein, partial [Chloroflexota bacterium]
MLQVLLSGETAAPGTTTGKTGIPNDLTAGGTTTVTVNAVDAFWNPVSSATPSVTIAASPAQITGLPSTASLSSGARSLVLTPTTAGDFVLTATDNGGSPLTSGTSDGFTVFAGSATHLRVTAPGSTTAGAQFNVTVTALDGYDNAAPTYAGAVHFTSTDGGATLPANSTLTNGAGTFSATLATQGTQTITGTDTNTGTITGTSNSITVAPSAAQTISLVLSPTSITANFSATTTATVTIKDGSNNPLQGKTVTITQNGDVTVGTVTDNHNGTYTATITASKTSGVTTITATDTTDSIFTTTNLTEVAGPATQLAVLLPGETIAAGTGVKSWTSSAYVATAGTAFNITVRALDQYFNLATTATPTVTFASRIAGSADSTAVLPGSTTLVGGTRTVSVTPKAATTTTNWVIVASSNPLVDGTGTAIKVDAGAA